MRGICKVMGWDCLVGWLVATGGNEAWVVENLKFSLTSGRSSMNAEFGLASDAAGASEGVLMILSSPSRYSRVTRGPSARTDSLQRRAPQDLRIGPFCRIARRGRSDTACIAP